MHSLRISLTLIRVKIQEILIGFHQFPSIARIVFSRFQPVRFSFTRQYLMPSIRLATSPDGDQHVTGFQKGIRSGIENGITVFLLDSQDHSAQRLPSTRSGQCFSAERRILLQFDLVDIEFKSAFFVISSMKSTTRGRNSS